MNQLKRMPAPLLKALSSTNMVAPSRILGGIRNLITKASLAGTTPHHNVYVLLHSPRSPESFPSVISSPIQKALQLQLVPLNGLVNFTWPSKLQAHQPSLEWHEEDSYSATVFHTNGRPLEIERISLSNLTQVVKQISAHSQAESVSPVGPTQIYVCTHGSRDCRCGETGGQVASALRTEIQRRDLLNTVKLGETAHVGGHKFAANVLVYPQGEWLGNVTPEDAPSILDAILAQPRQDWNLNQSEPLCSPHWRGRMGLDKEQQIALYATAS